MIIHRFIFCSLTVVSIKRELGNSRSHIRRCAYRRRSPRGPLLSKVSKSRISTPTGFKIERQIFGFMPVNCTKCGTQIQPNERECSNCGRDAGFPNVRAANISEERDALKKRFEIAHTSSVTRGTTIELDNFMREVGSHSRAVMNRNLAALNNWVEGSTPLFLNFHYQIELLGRAPNESNFDQQRNAAESAINPFCYRDISYAALTLSAGGMANYGPYSVFLKDLSIDERSSVFEENPFVFNRRHHVFAGQNPPLGYRAPWADRGTLAGAKLEHKLEKGMQALSFPAVLMEDRGDDPDCDYIEVHIFGRLSRASIEKVIGPIPSDRSDRTLWKRTVRALRNLGVEVKETP